MAQTILIPVISFSGKGVYYPITVKLLKRNSETFQVRPLAVAKIKLMRIVTKQNRKWLSAIAKQNRKPIYYISAQH